MATQLSGRKQIVIWHMTCLECRYFYRNLPNFLGLWGVVFCLRLWVLSFSSLVPLLGVFLYLFFYFILGRSANFHLDYSPKVSNLMVPIGLMLNSLTLLMILTVFLLLVNFCQFVTWKIRFQPLPRIFHEKMDPNSPDIELFFKLPDLYDKFQVDSKNIEQF